MKIYHKKINNILKIKLYIKNILIFNVMEFNKVLKIIFKYHKINKKLLFLGINKKILLLNFFKKFNNCSYLLQNFNGIFSNIYVLKNLNVYKQNQYIQFLFNLKYNYDLIINFTQDNICINFYKKNIIPKILLFSVYNKKCDYNLNSMEMIKKASSFYFFIIYNLLIKFRRYLVVY